MAELTENELRFLWTQRVDESEVRTAPTCGRALIRKPDAGNRLAYKATCSRRNENAQNAN
jgi:hypothetical protein